MGENTETPGAPSYGDRAKDYIKDRFGKIVDPFASSRSGDPVLVDSLPTEYSIQEKGRKKIAKEELEKLNEAVKAANASTTPENLEKLEEKRHVVAELVKQGLYDLGHEGAEAVIAAVLVSRGASPKTAIFGAHAAVELLNSDKIKAGGNKALDTFRDIVRSLRSTNDAELKDLADSIDVKVNETDSADSTPAAAGGAGAGGTGGDGGGDGPPEIPTPIYTPENGDEGGENEENNKETSDNEEEARPRRQNKGEKKVILTLQNSRDQLIDSRTNNFRRLNSIYESDLADYESRARREISQKVYNKHSGDPNITPEQIEMEVETELINAKKEFTLSYESIVSDPDNIEVIGREAYLNEKLAIINSLLDAGIINDISAGELRSIVTEIAEQQEQIFEINKILGNSEGAISAELERAIYNGQVEFPPSQLKLLHALDSPRRLAQFINENDRYLHAGKDWYKLFNQDVSEIFESIISIASSQPNEPFMQNISMMYEGALHKFLVGRLKTNLPRALEQQKDKKYLRLRPLLTGQDDNTPEDQWESLATFQVVEQQIRSLSKEAESTYDEELRGREQRSYRFSHDIEFYRGVEILGDRMAKNFERTQILHDTEVAERLGLGFEELAKSAERLRQEDIDEMFMQNPDLARVFRVYKQSLNSFLGLKGHIISSDFGEIYKYMAMDNIQSMAFQSLYGHIKMNEGESDFIYQRRLKGLIRQAAGLSKVTMAYHAQLLPRRLLISREIVYDRDEKTGIIKGIKKVKKKLTYVSARIAALETNLTEFDPRKLMDRFHIPNSLPGILSAFSPKDKKNYDPWRDQFKHSDILKHAEESDEAFFIGRTPWLAQFDRKNRTLGELAQIKTIDRFLRGGWRDVQYDLYMVKKEVDIIDKDGRFMRRDMVPDAVETMENMRRLGTIFVARFLDEYLRLDHDTHLLKDGNENPFLHITYQEVAERYASPDDSSGRIVDEIWHNLQHLKANQNDKKAVKSAIESLKVSLYEKEVFERMFAARPTQVLAFEFPRYTPRAEYTEGNTVYQQVYRLMKAKFPNVGHQYLEDEVLPFFVSALSSVENAEWDKRRPDDQSTLSYRLTEEMIRERAVENDQGIAPLRKMFEFYMSQQGTEKDISRVGFDESYEFDDFLNDLVEFSAKIQIETFRHDRHIGLQANETETTTFSRRYAETLLIDEKDEIKILLSAGIDVANEEYIMQASGSRVTQRTLGEAKGLQAEVSPALKKLLLNDILEVMREDLDSEEAILKAADTLNESIMKHIHMTEQLHGEPQAYQDAVDWAIMIYDRMLGKDRIYRGSMGSIIGTVNRELRGRAESLAQTINPKTPEMTPAALDTNGVAIGVKSLLNKAGVPWKEKTIVGYEDEVLSNITAKKISTYARRLDSSVGRIPLIGNRISNTFGWQELAQASEEDVNEVIKKRFITDSNNPVMKWAMNVLHPGKPIFHSNPDNGQITKKVIGMTFRDAAIEDWPKLIGLAALVIIAAAIAANEEEKKK